MYFHRVQITISLCKHDIHKMNQFIYLGFEDFQIKEGCESILEDTGVFCVDEGHYEETVSQILDRIQVVSSFL